MAQSTRSKAVILAVAFVVIVLLMILSASRGLSRYSCEVCVEFNGRSKCRTAAGSTREEAQKAATDNACAFLATGMTESLRCAATPPTSVRCRP